MIRKVILIVAVTALLMGCQTLSERKQSDALQEILRSYEAMIRWGSVEQAKGFLRPGQVGEVEATTPRNMRVTHYEVVQGPTMLDSSRAMQTAIIQYVFEESQVVREMMNRQTWEYDQESERWFLVTPLPAFK
ncbi:MAG: asparagine synthetase [Candidatus Thiodiazotropha sp. (ex Myrtea spinifera)]|nr:asparagine synthetase [Candidatus Thiodiazotropha sp. (ex Myrtea spinifera)]MCU7828619.1 asparagine synthetase [Candidatus Thiodiazotropha sp. (ex Myrtea sp. 'scaly one' KF741663)]